MHIPTSSIISRLTGLILLLSLLSCSSGKSEEPVGTDGSQAKDIHIGVDTDHRTRCDVTFLNQKTGNVVFFDRDANSNVSAIHFVNNKDTHFLSIYFDAKGYVQTICNENLSAIFTNYTETTVDLAIVRGDSFKLIKNYDIGTSWMQDYYSNIFDERHANGSETEESKYFYVRSVLLRQRMFMADKILGIMSTNGYLEVKEDAKWAIAVMNKLMDLEDGEESGIKIDKSEGSYQQYSSNLPSADIRYDKLTQSLQECKMWVPFYEWWFRYFDSVYAAREVDRNLGQGAIDTGQGALKVTLAWQFLADIDVHVIEPNGNEISFRSKHSNYSDGFLDHDDTRGGNAIENVFWQHPFPGHYRVFLHYYGAGSSGSAGSGNCKVTIIKNGEGRVYDIPMRRIGQHETVAEFDL